MTISYPLSYPAGVPNPVRVRFTPHAAVSVSTSPFTGQAQVQQHQGQWWQVEMEFSNLSREQADALNAFRLRLNGRYGTFLFGDPAASLPRGAATGVPTVRGSGQNGNSLLTHGWTPNVSGILLAGDYIQIGSGQTTRLYKLTADASSDEIGNATLEVWPKLRLAPAPHADASPILTRNTVGVFRMSSNSMEWSTLAPARYGITLAALEAL
ncbi:MAG: hypothetical protein ABT940_11420 [Alphaproteobacteria bacterium]